MEEKLKMISDHPEVDRIKPEFYMNMATYYVHLKNGSYITITDIHLNTLTKQQLDSMITEELKKVRL